MRKYETMLIIKPDLTEDATESVVDKLSTLIENNQGEIVNVDKWGTKELAYEINDYKSGYYVLINFKGIPVTVEELERVYRINDEILRYLIVRDEQ